MCILSGTLTKPEEGVQLILFVFLEAIQESLGFSFFNLLFEHTNRGSLKVYKETWLKDEPSVNLLDYVSNLQLRIYDACEVARKNFKHS